MQLDCIAVIISDLLLTTNATVACLNPFVTRSFRSSAIKSIKSLFHLFPIIVGSRRAAVMANSSSTPSLLKVTPRPIWRFIVEGDRKLELDALGGVGGRL